jgi:hypothetical protein
MEDVVNNKPKHAQSGEISENAEASQNELWNQLGHAVTMAAKEDQIIWTIFGVFWAANAVLLVALFTTGQLPTTQIGIVVSVTGTILSCVWFIIQQRAIRWLKYYEMIIFRLEDKYLKIPPDVTLSPGINKTTFMEKVGSGISVRSLMVGSGVVTALLWFASLLGFVALLCFACK